MVYGFSVYHVIPRYPHDTMFFFGDFLLEETIATASPGAGSESPRRGGYMAAANATADSWFGGDTLMYLAVQLYL